MRARICEKNRLAIIDVWFLVIRIWGRVDGLGELLDSFVSSWRMAQIRWNRRTRENGAQAPTPAGNPRRVTSIIAPAGLLVKLRKRYIIKRTASVDLMKGDLPQVLGRNTHNVPNIQKAKTRWDTAHKVAMCILRCHHRFGGPTCMGLDEELPSIAIRGAKKFVASASRAIYNCPWDPRRAPSASMSSILPSNADGGSERLYKSLMYIVV